MNYIDNNKKLIKDLIKLKFQLPLQIENLLCEPIKHWYMFV